MGNSLVVQWLGLGALAAVGLGLIPGWGTKILQAEWHGKEKTGWNFPGFQCRGHSFDAWLGN